MTAIDPLTYLDEVDAHAEVYIPALSKALRAVLGLVDPIIDAFGGQLGTHSANCHERHAVCLAVAMKQQVQAALAVNDEGGTDRG